MGGFAEAASIGKSLIGFAAAQDQKRAIQAQAELTEAANKTKAATERLNSQKRQAERLEEFRRAAAHNAAYSGTTGVSGFAGSATNITRTALGRTRKANYEDVFNAENTVQAIRTANAIEQAGFKAKQRAATFRGYNSLLGGFSDLS